MAQFCSEYHRVNCNYDLRKLQKVYDQEGYARTFLVNGRAARRAFIPAENDFRIFDGVNALDSAQFQPDQMSVVHQLTALQNLGELEKSTWREEPSQGLKRLAGSALGNVPKKPRGETTLQVKTKNKRGTRGAAKRMHRAGKASQQAGGDEYLARATRQGTKLLRNAQIHSTSRVSLKEDGRHVSTGWHGKEPPKIEREKIIRLWESGEIYSYLKNFHLIPHNTHSKYPTVLLDSHLRSFIYRSSSIDWLKARSSELNDALDSLIGSMLRRPEVTAAAKRSRRGIHYANILGYYRQYAKKPILAQFHKQHPDKAEAFIQSPIVRSIVGFVDRALSAFFPGIAQRYKQCADWHKEKWNLQPHFGLFFNFCVNGILPGQRRVHCKPHSDSKNVVGVCALLVYQLEGSNFNHKLKSWLVIWEAGVIIEIPPWVLVLYPSALFFHFNVDIDKIDVVVTDGQKPTLENSQSIMNGKESDGRGSIVLFNEATMMMSSETDSATLKQAIAAGKSGAVDYNEKIDEGFPQFEKLSRDL